VILRSLRFQSAVEHIVLEVVHSQVAADHSHLVVRTLLVVGHRQVVADRMHLAVHRSHQPARIERSAGHTGWVDCSDQLDLGTMKASALATQTRLMPVNFRVFRSIVKVCRRQKKGGGLERTLIAADCGVRIGSQRQCTQMHSTDANENAR